MTSNEVPRPLLGDAGYARIWLVGLATGVVRWLEMLALGVLAFDLTGSPALVALLVILRFLPLALFGLLLGALADLVAPQRLIAWGLAGMALVSAVMWALFRFGEPSYAQVCVAVLLSGVFWAGDLPVRRKIMADLVGAGALARAMAVDGAASNGTRALGPIAGGAIYQLVGIDGVFALSTVLYLLALVAAAGLPAPAREPAAAAGLATRLIRPLRGALEAARHAAGDPDARRILGVTIVFNIWGFPMLAMVPVLGRDPLDLPAAAVGALTSLEGLFAFLGSVVLARLARPSAGAGRRLYLAAVALHLGMVGFIGVVGGVGGLAFGLAVAGACAAAFSTMQSTLIWLVAPPEMRGRYLGLMTICIGAGVLGFANIGLTAEWLGAADALKLSAAQGLLALLPILRGWTALRCRADTKAALDRGDDRG